MTPLMLTMLTNGAKDLLFNACNVKKNVKVQKRPLTENCHLLFPVDDGAKRLQEKRARYEGELSMGIQRQWTAYASELLEPDDDQVSILADEI